MTSDQMKKIIPNMQKTPDEKVGVVGNQVAVER